MKIQIYKKINFFRQVAPSQNNSAVKCLSKEIQQRNIRKVEVNARVAFVICILELLANVCIMFALSFVYGKTTFGTLTMSMIWYYIILPHTHRMNTSHNKHLIVDHGWTNTIRNVIGVQKRHSDVQNMKACSSGAPKTATKMDGQVGISSISKSECKSNDFLKDDTMESKAQDEYPSTSNINTTGVRKKAVVDLSQYSDSSSVEDVNGTDSSQNRNYRLSIGEKLLSYMLDNIISDERYLFYFKQLVEFEEIHNVDKSRSKDFKIIEITGYEKPNGINETCILSHVKSKETLSETNMKTSLRTDKNQQSRELTLKINFVTENPEIINLRRDILEDWHIHCMNEELYDCFVNRLIDLEESLLIN